jgi:hypothetical protein
VRYERGVLQCAACRKSFAPLDRELGANDGARMTRSVVRRVAYAGALMSYSLASQALRELGGIEVGRSQVQRVVLGEGARIDARQRREEAARSAPLDPLRPVPQPAVSSRALVIEADATCVLTVADEEHKSVYCATAFALESRTRKNGRAMIAERAYTASAETMEDFSVRTKALAWRMGMRGAERVAFVGDGARCLWKWAEENLPGETVFIQDFWHVCEHLADLARDLFGETWQKPFRRWKNRLRAGKVKTILRDLGCRAAHSRGWRRKRLEEEIVYLRAGCRRMDYPRYEREGWPIGSGAIEGTCKHLVKERFGVTGAQWRRTNIPALLALRLSIFNQDWDADWNEQAA